jgi:hypothetical protein
MSAVREGHPFPGPSVIGVERVAGLVGNRHDAQQVDRTVGAGDDESPLLEADVRFGRFKRLGGDPLALSR